MINKVYPKAQDAELVAGTGVQPLAYSPADLKAMLTYHAAEATPRATAEEVASGAGTEPRLLTIDQVAALGGGPGEPPAEVAFASILDHPILGGTDLGKYISPGPLDVSQPKGFTLPIGSPPAASIESQGVALMANIPDELVRFQMDLTDWNGADMLMYFLDISGQPVAYGGYFSQAGGPFFNGGPFPNTSGHTLTVLLSSSRLVALNGDGLIVDVPLAAGGIVFLAGAATDLDHDRVLEIEYENFDASHDAYIPGDAVLTPWADVLTVAQSAPEHINVEEAANHLSGKILPITVKGAAAAYHYSKLKIEGLAEKVAFTSHPTKAASDWGFPSTTYGAGARYPANELKCYSAGGIFVWPYEITPANNNDPMTLIGLDASNGAGSGQSRFDITYGIIAEGQANKGLTVQYIGATGMVKIMDRNDPGSAIEFSNRDDPYEKVYVAINATETTCKFYYKKELKFTGSISTWGKRLLVVDVTNVSNADSNGHSLYPTFDVATEYYPTADPYLSPLHYDKKIISLDALPNSEWNSDGNSTARDVNSEISPAQLKTTVIKHVGDMGAVSDMVTHHFAGEIANVRTPEYRHHIDGSFHKYQIWCTSGSNNNGSIDIYVDGTLISSIDLTRDTTSREGLLTDVVEVGFGKTLTFQPSFTGGMPVDLVVRLLHYGTVI